MADAYLRGAEKVTEILRRCSDNGVQTVSVYNLSRANLERTTPSWTAVYRGIDPFSHLADSRQFRRATCSVRLHGDRKLAPRQISCGRRDDLEAAMTGSGFRINVLAAYDAGDELRAAHARAQREGCDINAAFDIATVDMVIRTTPEPLLSGFLPMQSQYAQLVFLTTPLNDLDERHIDDLVADYRRFPQLRGR